MKTATGTYLNLYSEWEEDTCDNDMACGKIDIFIFFPEYMGSEVDLDEAEEIARRVIKEFSVSAEDAESLTVLKEKLEQALLDFDVQVIVKNYYNIDESKITDTACVSCIWDVDGIWVNFNYAYDELRGDMDSVLCFCELYTDGEPDEDIWKDAQRIANLLKKQYRVELHIRKDELDF